LAASINFAKELLVLRRFHAEKSREGKKEKQNGFV